MNNVIEKYIKKQGYKRYFQVLEIDGKEYIHNGAPIMLLRHKFIKPTVLNGKEIKEWEPVRDPRMMEFPDAHRETILRYFSEKGDMRHALDYGLRVLNLKRIFDEMYYAGHDIESKRRIARLKAYILKEGFEMADLELTSANGARMFEIKFQASFRFSLDGGKLQKIKESSKGKYALFNGQRWYFPEVKGLFLPYTVPPRVEYTKPLRSWARRPI